MNSAVTVSTQGIKAWMYSRWKSWGELFLIELNWLSLTRIVEPSEKWVMQASSCDYFLSSNISYLISLLTLYSFSSSSSGFTFSL